MKKICFIITNLIGGGAEKILITLARELMQRGHQVDIITLNAWADYPVEGLNIHTIEYDDRNRAPLIALLAKYNRFLHHLLARQSIHNLRTKINELGGNFDLFVSHLLEPDVLCITAKLPNLYCCLHEGISTRFTNDKAEAKTWYKFIEKMKLSHLYTNQNIITVSKSVQHDALAFGIKPKNIQTIYNPFNFNKIKNQAQAYPVEEDNYIISVGSIYAHKRHDKLIQAYASANIKEKLLIMGKGSEEKTLQKLIEKMNLQRRVKFVGFNPNPYPYIQKAKALVVSGDVEGLPSVLIEALILHTPVVSTACHGAQEILVDELAEFISPIGDVEALAQNIRKVVTNPPKIEERFYAKFSHTLIADRYLELCS